MRRSFVLYLLLIISVFAADSLFAQRGSTSSQRQAVRVLNVVTEPNASIWLDGVLWGTTDDSGNLLLKPVPAGRRELRVRADGFRQVSQIIQPAQKGQIRVKLTKTTDTAELAFQQAEKQASGDKIKAAELYRNAIEIRPAYAEAFVGLARVLEELGEFEDARQAIAKARKVRASYAEASAVEGRIFRSEEEDDRSIAAFKRAIREGRGFQPEAYTGLALLFKGKAETAGNTGDFQGEQENYEEAVKYFASAVEQLAGAPDAQLIYQIYGLILEKMERNEDAIRVYEKFLRVFPDSSEAGAIRSFIVQLKKQQ